MDTPAPTSPSSPNVIKSTSLNDDLFERNENYLRNVDKFPKIDKESALEEKKNVSFILNKLKEINLNEVAKRNKSKFRYENKNAPENHNRNSTRPAMIPAKKNSRRNDKFLHRRPTNPEDYELFNLKEHNRPSSVNYYDCMTAGWGKFSSSGDLSDVLLKINVPIHHIKRLAKFIIHCDF
jgi:hypothetical protein